MIRLLSQTQRDEVEPEPSPGQEFCRAAGLIGALPERLLIDAGGRPFEPVKLTITAEPAALAEQAGLLMRELPIGGWERLVQSNSDQVVEASLARLRRRLGAGGRGVPARGYLSAVQQQLRKVSDELAREREQVEQDYAGGNTTLRAWQERTRKQPGLLQHIGAFLLGSAGTLALPQAIALFNEREQLTMRRGAVSAAAGVVDRCGDEVGALLDGLDALREEASLLAAQAQHTLTALARPAAYYSPWTWRCDVSTVAGQLAAQASADELALGLFDRLAASGAVEQLGALVRELVREEAARLLAPLELAQLIEAEAAAMPVEAEEPLVLVGKGLLNLLSRQPTWRLTRTAQLQSETLQLTAGGEPLFELDGLGAAAYGMACDRFGFVQVELGAALDDLALFHEGRALLEGVLAHRNCYALEELALAWERMKDEG